MNVKTSQAPTTVGLYANPMSCKRPPATTLVGRGLHKLQDAVVWKANGRDADYMRELFAERYPGAAMLELENDQWQEPTAAAGRVFLLYPDCIGLGWTIFEARIVAAISSGTELRVLNGRKRDFKFNLPIWMSMFARRVIERTMLVELAAIPLFLAVTPALLIYDTLRGRR